MYPSTMIEDAVVIYHEQRPAEYLSKKFILIHYLNWTDEQIKENDRMLVEEKVVDGWDANGSPTTEVSTPPPNQQQKQYHAPLRQYTDEQIGEFFLTHLRKERYNRAMKVVSHG